MQLVSLHTGAITISMALHCLILYVPWLATTFSVAPLGYKEWRAIIWFSFPVILVDEILKLISRRFKGRIRMMMTRGDLLPRSMRHQS
jgi:Ca2+ transporting ATPase